VSIFLLLFGAFFVYSGFGHSYSLPTMWQTAVNISIIGIGASGTLLYIVGYRKGELEDFPLLLVSGIFLILWGLVVSYFTVLLYNDFLDWAMQPFTRAVTLWDNLEYATWEIKGLLWIVAGLTFIITDLRR
jgi:hypothetical protein